MKLQYFFGVFGGEARVTKIAYQRLGSAIQRWQKCSVFQNRPKTEFS